MHCHDNQYQNMHIIILIISIRGAVIKCMNFRSCLVVRWKDLFLLPACFAVFVGRNVSLCYWRGMWQFVLQLMRNMIDRCLKTAAQNGLRSVAFPTVGCGRLGYRPEVVAACFSRAVQNCKTPLSVMTLCLMWNLFLFQIAMFIRAAATILKTRRQTGRAPPPLPSSPPPLRPVRSRPLKSS